MLKNVKSSYFIRIIFSFIYEKQKLKLIKYNKSFQKNMNISLINYKNFSGKYIIYEQNGKGKEYYYDGKLKIKGSYLNEKIWFGKGKEYYNNGILKYEGEYFKGEKNGKGKQFYDNGNIEFDGEYLNGKKNGKGKEYYKNGNLIFEGEYLNGERNGKGKEYHNNGKLKFEGKYLNGKKVLN